MPQAVALEPSLVVRAAAAHGDYDYGGDNDNDYYYHCGCYHDNGGYDMWCWVPPLFAVI